MLNVGECHGRIPHPNTSAGPSIPTLWQGPVYLHQAKLLNTLDSMIDFSVLYNGGSHDVFRVVVFFVAWSTSEYKETLTSPCSMCSMQLQINGSFGRLEVCPP